MAEPAMQGQGGGSHTWTEQVWLRIIQEAQGVHRSIPPSFRRFDAFGNEDHPSIFKRRHRTNDHVAVAVAPTTPPLPQLRGSSDPIAPPVTQPPLELSSSRGAAPQIGCSGGQLQAKATDGRDDVVVAAVGPYHYGHHLSARTPPLITSAKKCGIVKFLADRFRLDVDAFLRWATENQANVQRCYERDSFKMSPEELAEMLLLDGCLLLFAVFLLRTSVCEDQRPAALSRDGAHGHGREFIYLSADISLHMKQTRLDLLMLDNQIPFFVLAELHRRLKDTLFARINHSIEELALSCFDDIHPCCIRSPRRGRGRGRGHGVSAAGNDGFPERVHHLLHLFHWSRVPKDKHAVKIADIVPKEPKSHLPSATELKESLAFNKAHSGCSSLDISFRRRTLGMCGVMSIPALCIHNYSERVFRSLIAFEQNHLRCGLGVTAYSICMAQLLQSEDDAKLLRKREILVHTQKTDKEIVDFFRGLRDEYADTSIPEDLLDLYKEVAAHQQSRAGGMVKWVRRQCFPKESITFFAIIGIIISVATLVNTIHSMYRYYHPFKGVNPP